MCCRFLLCHFIIIGINFIIIGVHVSTIFEQIVWYYPDMKYVQNIFSI